MRGRSGGNGLTFLRRTGGFGGTRGGAVRRGNTGSSGG